MLGDDPPYLEVGTEVSAKYKGAFCEAKVRKVVKQVKAKVSLKFNMGTVMVSDEFVKGKLNVGASVEVKHPEKGQYYQGTVTKIQDSSQYTVVFDDGDIMTLRRTSLCLKSGRHFTESESLDHLPLTHPEHFSNPVRGRRRPGAGDANSDSSSSSSSDADSEPDGPNLSPSKRAARKSGDWSLMIGKVVSVEVDSGKKKRDNWFPALVASPTAQIDARRDYLVRSFQDGRYYTVPKKETGSFQRDAAPKNNYNLKAAIEKALLYLDKNELPPHWDRDSLFGTKEAMRGEADSESDSCDEESREDKDHFVARLYKFMDDRGTPINLAPTVGSRDLDLHKLWRAVQRRGGYTRVTNQNVWAVVGRKLLHDTSSPVNTNSVKVAYKRYLLQFEEIQRKLGCSLLPNPRSSKARQSTGVGRSLIRERYRAPSGSSPAPPPAATPSPAPPATRSACESPAPGSVGSAASSGGGGAPKCRATAAVTTGGGSAKATRESRERKPSPAAKRGQAVTRKSTEAKENRRQSAAATAAVVVKQEEVKQEDVKPDVVVKSEEKNQNEKPPMTTRCREADTCSPVAPPGERKSTSSRERRPSLARPVPSPTASTGSTTSGRSSAASPAPPPPPNVGTDAPPEERRRSSGTTTGPAVRRRKDESPDHDDPESLPPYVDVEVGDKVSVLYKVNLKKERTIYEAKVLHVEAASVPKRYFIHYLNWNKRYDEWVKRNRIIENLSWAPTRARRHSRAEHKSGTPGPTGSAASSSSTTSSLKPSRSRSAATLTGRLSAEPRALSPATVGSGGGGVSSSSRPSSGGAGTRSAGAGSPSTSLQGSPTAVTTRRTAADTSEVKSEATCSDVDPEPSDDSSSGGGSVMTVSLRRRPSPVRTVRRRTPRQRAAAAGQVGADAAPTSSGGPRRGASRRSRPSPAASPLLTDRTAVVEADSTTVDLVVPATAAVSATVVGADPPAAGPSAPAGATTGDVYEFTDDADDEAFSGGSAGPLVAHYTSRLAKASSTVSSPPSSTCTAAAVVTATAADGDSSASTSVSSRKRRLTPTTIVPPSSDAASFPGRAAMGSASGRNVLLAATLSDADSSPPPAKLCRPVVSAPSIALASVVAPLGGAVSVASVRPFSDPVPLNRVTLVRASALGRLPPPPRLQPAPLVSNYRPPSAAAGLSHELVVRLAHVVPPSAAATVPIGRCDVVADLTCQETIPGSPERSALAGDVSVTATRRMAAAARSLETLFASAPPSGPSTLASNALGQADKQRIEKPTATPELPGGRLADLAALSAARHESLSAQNERRKVLLVPKPETPAVDPAGTSVAEDTAAIKLEQHAAAAAMLRLEEGTPAASESQHQRSASWRPSDSPVPGTQQQRLPLVEADAAKSKPADDDGTGRRVLPVVSALLRETCYTPSSTASDSGSDSPTPSLRGGCAEMSAADGDKSPDSSDVAECDDDGPTISSPSATRPQCEQTPSVNGVTAAQQQLEDQTADGSGTSVRRRLQQLDDDAASPQPVAKRRRSHRRHHHHTRHHAAAGGSTSAAVQEAIRLATAKAVGSSDDVLDRSNGDMDDDDARNGRNNFLVTFELDTDGDARVSVLAEQIDKLRDRYSSVKGELTRLHRRIKKLKKKHKDVSSASCTVLPSAADSVKKLRPSFVAQQ